MENWIDCTGDVCRSDVILFTEAIWSGSRKKPQKIGEREIRGVVVNDSYGADKNQHTFTIVVSCCSDNSILPNSKILRKGRNVYRNGTKRLLWEDEAARDSVLQEKHERGYENSLRREERIYGNMF